MTHTYAAVYARYSTDKQDARSIDDQLRRCREHAQRHGDVVACEHRDERNPARPVTARVSRRCSRRRRRVGARSR